MLEIFKWLLKTGDRFTAISDLQKNEERVLIQAGNRQLTWKFSEQVYCPFIPKIFLSPMAGILLLFCKQFLKISVHMKSWIPLKFHEFTRNASSLFLCAWGLLHLILGYLGSRNFRLNYLFPTWNKICSPWLWRSEMTSSRSFVLTTFWGLKACPFPRNP